MGASGDAGARTGDCAGLGASAAAAFEDDTGGDAHVTTGDDPICQMADAPALPLTVVWLAPPLGLLDDRSVTSQTLLLPLVKVSV